MQGVYERSLKVEPNHVASLCDFAELNKDLGDGEEFSAFEASTLLCMYTNVRRNLEKQQTYVFQTLHEFESIDYLCTYTSAHMHGDDYTHMHVCLRAPMSRMSGVCRGGRPG